MKDYQQNQSTHPLPFQVTSSTDHVSPAYGLAGSLKVGLHKNGASSVAPSGTIAEESIASPTGLTVTPAGAAGTTSYGYRVTALTADGETLPSAEVTTATGNAALSGTNYNALSWTAVTGASSYNVYGRTAGGELLMANVTGTTYSDTGAVAAPAGALPTTNTTSGGWYHLTPSATDCNTLGPLRLHAQATATSDPTDEEYSIVAYNPDDATALGLSAIPPQAHQVGSVLASPSPTSSAFTLTGLSGNVANRACYFKSGSANPGEWNEITGGTATNPTFYRAWTSAPAAGDQLVVLGLVK